MTDNTSPTSNLLLGAQMELSVVWMWLKKYWLAPVLGIVIGGLGGWACMYIYAATGLLEESHSAIVRVQFTGTDPGLPLPDEFDYRINGAIAVGLSDATVSRILRDAEVDPSTVELGSDWASPWVGLSVAKLDGAAIQVTATFDDPDVAQRIAADVLNLYVARVLGAFPAEVNVRADQTMGLVRDNNFGTSGELFRMILGGMAGLLVGLAVATLVNLRTRPIMTTEQAEAAAGVPVVADLHSRRRRRAAKTSMSRDELDMVVTKLALASDTTPRFVVWGSPSSAGFERTSSLARSFGRSAGPGWALGSCQGAKQRQRPESPRRTNRCPRPRY